jgi:hypothetical protein
MLATSAHAHDTAHGAVRNTMPQSVDFGDTEDNEHIRAFHETGCEPLPYDVEVNLDPQVHDSDYIYNEDGTMPEAGDPAWWQNRPFPATSVIPKDTPVVCILMHYDSDGVERADTQGGIRLDNDILGIITTTDLLERSDDACMAAIPYPAHVADGGSPYRGIEDDDGVQFRHLPQFDVVNVRLEVGNPGDQVRILKACKTRPLHRHDRPEIVKPDPEPDPEPEGCAVEILGDYRAAPGETIDIRWDMTGDVSSEIEIGIFSGWGEEYYLNTFAPNTGRLTWDLPRDLDPDLDYDIYIESAEKGEGTQQCWQYAALEVLP